MKLKRSLFVLLLVCFLAISCQVEGTDNSQGALTDESVNGLYVDFYRMSEEEERGFMFAGGRQTSLIYQAMTPQANDVLNITIWKLNKESGQWEELEKTRHISPTRRPLLILRNDLRDVGHGVYFSNSQDYTMENSVHFNDLQPRDGEYEYRVPIFLTRGEEMSYGQEYSLVANFYTNVEDGSFKDTPAEGSLKLVDIRWLYYNPDTIPLENVEEAYLWTFRVEEATE